MELKDLLLTPFYLLLVYFLAFAFKRKVKEKHLRKYILPGLTLKIIGAISVGLIYTFYYKGGDTMNFYNLGSIHMYNAFIESPIKGIRLFFENGEYENPDLFKYVSRIYYYGDSASFFIVKLSAFFGLFCFHTYTIIAIFFAVISFSGCWLMFSAFCRLYPKYYKQGAIAIFFIPSVFFWGSGLLKDSITFGAMGAFFYAFTNIFIFKEKIRRSIALFILSIIVLKIVKIYILLCLLPGTMLWIFLIFSSKLKAPVSKFIFRPLIVIFGLTMAYFAADKISKENAQYSLDNIASTAKITSDWLAYMSKIEKGSYYSIGEFDGTVDGMIKLAPAGIWVTLFRPYLWESKNVVMLISGLESTAFLLFTIYVILKVGFLKSLRIIKSEPFLLFCLIFSFAFAFAIGISSSNFGTLVRYKIPLLPFYYILIALVLEKGKKVKKKPVITNLQPQSTIYTSQG